MYMQDNSAVAYGIPMSRSVSGSSTDSSVLHTPSGQALPPVPNFVLRRLNSVSSMGLSADDDEVVSTEAYMNWAAKDDDLLLTVYQSYLDNPTNAPFQGFMPPSGVVGRVAKDTVKRAKVAGIPFPHSIGAIRKRLLLLCNRQEATGFYEQPRTPLSQPDEYFAPNLASWRNSSSPSSPVQRPSSANSMFSFEMPLASPFIEPTPHQQQQQYQNYNGLAAPMPIPSQSRGASNSPHTEDLNFTSQRKRDSLMKKRGMQ